MFMKKLKIHCLESPHSVLYKSYNFALLNSEHSLLASIFFILTSHGPIFGSTFLSVTVFVQLSR